jgi:hypothetical protein
VNTNEVFHAWSAIKAELGVAGTPGVAIRHHDNHRLAALARDQVVEDEVAMPLLRRSLQR